ncbi:MAG: hypothetical protein KBC84_04145, partial [Proteobacteria bacterium]|nr:hypothetical protein [Pseudomonadota bacterium]
MEISPDRVNQVQGFIASAFTKVGLSIDDVASISLIISLANVFIVFIVLRLVKKAVKTNDPERITYKIENMGVKLKQYKSRYQEDYTKLSEEVLFLKNHLEDLHLQIASDKILKKADSDNFVK